MSGPQNASLDDDDEVKVTHNFIEGLVVCSTVVVELNSGTPQNIHSFRQLPPQVTPFRTLHTNSKCLAWTEKFLPIPFMTITQWTQFLV